jgi:hypothetical protein
MLHTPPKWHFSGIFEEDGKSAMLAKTATQKCHPILEPTLP